MKITDAQKFLSDIASFFGLAQSLENESMAFDKQTGYCACCNQLVDFIVKPTPNDGWYDMRGGFICPSCNLSGRLRMFYDVASKFISASNVGIIFEKITPFFDFMKVRYPLIEGVEFLSTEMKSGEVGIFSGREIVHQDKMDSSYREQSLDFIMHSDVLEHVPDYIKALSENFRILKSGGKLIFACPIYNHYEHVKHASVDNLGTVVHHCDPCYHGNPLSEKGSLVFTSFGYRLLDDLKEVGFQEVDLIFEYNIFNGYVSNHNPYYEVGHMWPVMIVATR